MKVIKLLTVISVILNCYLLITLYKKLNLIESQVINEMVLTYGIQDLSYFLKNSGIKKDKLFELSKTLPISENTSRVAPVLNENRYYSFPIEIIFSENDTIQSIKVGNQLY